MLRCEINTFTTVHMLGLKKCEKIHELDEEDSHPRSHHRKSRDDNLVEDVAYHQGGSNNHLLRSIDVMKTKVQKTAYRVGEGKDEDGSGGGPAQACLHTPLLLG